VRAAWLDRRLSIWSVNKPRVVHRDFILFLSQSGDIAVARRIEKDHSPTAGVAICGADAAVQAGSVRENVRNNSKT